MKICSIHIKPAILTGIFTAFMCAYTLYISKLINDIRQYSRAFHTISKATDIMQPKETKKESGQARAELWNYVEDMLKKQRKEIGTPKIIGIGMEHCGMETLVQLLRPHPSVRINSNNHSISLQNLNDAHVDKYIDTLPQVEASAFLLEKKPSGFYLPPYNLPYFLKKMFPKAKLLLVLCEPSKRVFDDFAQEWMSYNNSNESPFTQKYESVETFLSAYIPMIRREVGEYKKEWSEIDAEHKLYDLLNLQRRYYLTTILTKSFYALHLKRWQNYFGTKSLMILDSQELYSDPGVVVERVQDFVKLPKLLLKDDYVKNASTGEVCFKSWKATDDIFPCLPNPPLTSIKNGHDALSNLKLLFKSHNEELYDMIGKRFDW